MNHPPPSWQAIHELEIHQAYPDAIDALEARLAKDPHETEAIIRLGFNLWYAVAEEPCLKIVIPAKQYAARFMALFKMHHEAMKSNADFCWAFGLGMHLFWFYFPGATEEMGKELLNRACELDEFWVKLHTDNSDTTRLRGRGIFQSYYNVQ